MPSPDGEREPLLEERLDLADHVVVVRLRLHRPRLAAHVGEAAVRARAGHHAGELGGEAKGGHVVHERRARRERRLGHLALGRVDRDPVAGRREPLDHRDGAVELLGGGHGLGARARGRAADVEDRGALGHQLRAPCSTAASGSRKRPPSENESGVTLTMPMTE